MPYYVSSEYPDHGTMLQTVLVVYEGLVTRHLGSMYSGIDKCRQLLAISPALEAAKQNKARF